MASGMNTKGTPGRCYGFFKDFKQCMQEFHSNTGKDSQTLHNLAYQCEASREDYFECLHGRKETIRKLEMLSATGSEAAKKKLEKLLNYGNS